MQVATAEPVLHADPGQVVEFLVDVVNTSELIDGVSATLIGLPDATVSAEPQMLPLFPDAQGQVRMRVQVPTTIPAGIHPFSVELLSHAGNGTHHVDLELSVAARPDVELRADPKLVRARRSAQFVVEVENTGNTALDIQLRGEREDRRTTVTFTPSAFSTEPGSSTPVVVRVRGPRMFTGAELERRVSVDLRARRVHVIPAMLDTEDEPEIQASTQIVLKQRPLIGRGLLTALILICIVALWALAFLLGLTQVFSNDPLTKTVPTSFPTSVVRGDSASGNADPEEGATVPGAAPAGALPKTGLVPIGVGGSITGVVSATSNSEPIGRITVQAYRDGRRGPILVGSAASQSDGSYNVSGLFPTDYRLKFSAKGYRPVWYLAATARGGSAQVGVVPQTPTTGVNAVITGRPATIKGSIDPGDALTPPLTTITARMVGGTAGGATTDRPAARTVSDADGNYTLNGLPAPGTYELSLTAPGYQVTKVLTKVAGGETRLQPSIVPGAGRGSIAGTVTSGDTPLGNVTVSTSVAGEPVTVTTPTVGAVGAFSLGSLPTPGTYVLTFSAPDHGTTTRIVDLGAGKNESGLRVDLSAGSGTVTGRLTAADETGLGGATVTVGGATLLDGATAPSTTTLTGGDVGAFTISGLATPGEYTLTFTLDGYTSETVPVTLSSGAGVSGLDVVLGTKMGRVSGKVTGPGGAAYAGATVSVTNGTQTWTATSSAAGGALGAGGYLVTGLPPGTYSVTVSADRLRQQTAMVTVYAGVNSIQKLQLGAP